MKPKQTERNDKLMTTTTGCTRLVTDYGYINSSNGREQLKLRLLNIIHGVSD